MEPLQEKCLEMAEYFVQFCKENDLLCYLCGGGAIGTLRHKGFIPWDDDLDFFMPRKDYEKLAQLWPQKADSRYQLSKSNENYIDRNLFITIRDTQTTCIKPYQQDLDIPHGLALDVLPLDYYPANELSRKKQVIAAWKKAEAEMTKYTKEESDGITELCSGPYYMKKKYPISSFEDALWLPFEETKLPIPIGYDAYLKTAFGDYMTPPPVEKQVAHHDAVLVDLEKSYTHYKGEYYGR